MPIEEGPKKPEEKQSVQKKLVMVPAELNVKAISKPNELDSPLYNKRKVQNSCDKGKEEAEGRYDVLLVRRVEAIEGKTGKDVVELK